MCSPTTNNTSSSAAAAVKIPQAPKVPKDLIMKIVVNTKTTASTGLFLKNKVDQEIKETFSVNENRGKLEIAEARVKAILEAAFPGIKVWSTGSFPSGVDLHSSDLDMSMKIPDLEGRPISKLFEVRKKLNEEFKKHFSKCYVQKARIPVLQLVDRKTGVEIDITVDNEDGKRNTQLLVLYGQVDARFPLLCKAVKAWAGAVGVEGASKARLNSFSLCLMVASYLQVGVSPAILPNLQELFPELNGEIEVENDKYAEWGLMEKMEAMEWKMEPNDATIGELYLGFMEYYTNFDFKNNWISVSQGKVLPKRSDEEGRPLDGMPETWKTMIIQDPFYNRNCGDTVWHDGTFERLHREFGLTLRRIQRTKTIFGAGFRSTKRRLEIDEMGMKGDLMLEVWKAEMEEARQQRLKESSEPSISPGSDAWAEWEKNGFDGWITHYPFHKNQHPKYFWDEEGRPTDLEPWPVAEKMMSYDFL